MEKETRKLVLDIYEKVIGQSDLDWAEICAKNNLDCHPDTLRKAGNGIKLAADAGVIDFRDHDGDGYDELYKNKVKFYDQRREYNKLLAADARAEELVEQIGRAAAKAAELKPLVVNDKVLYTDYYAPTEGLLVLSDWHYGLTTDNLWNKYNIDIANERIVKLAEAVIAKIAKNGVTKLHVALAGDMVVGIAHVTNRLKTSLDFVDQIMAVSERIAELINHLSGYVETVTVYTTWGNHSRVVADLKSSIHTDNLERLIPFWLAERFKDRNDIIIPDTSPYELIQIKPCGVPVGVVHGDLDSNKEAMLTNALMYEKAYGEQMKYLFMGHLHHIHSVEQMDIEQIGCGSLCGTEDYAKDRRLFSKPSQGFFVFTPKGLDSIHHIDLR